MQRDSKQAQDNVKSIVATEWLEQFAESTSEHKQETDTNKKKQLMDDSFETFMTHTFLQNSDRNKCGSLKKNSDTT